MSKLNSFVVPILDFSPHSPYNISTLLNDLERLPGEVICVFNSKETYEKMSSHKRIDKFCYNNMNCGVSRAWNIGMNLAEGDSVFILNADLHVEPEVVTELADYLHSLQNAVIVGPQGSHIDFENLKVIRYFKKNGFRHPVRTHDVSGFLFCVHRQRFLQHSLNFDVQFSPCFFEEWDMGLQIIRAGLACYAVPVTGFDHHWGASRLDANTRVNYFGREMGLRDIHARNRKRFIRKWGQMFSGVKVAESENKLGGMPPDEEHLEKRERDIDSSEENHEIECAKEQRGGVPILRGQGDTNQPKGCGDGGLAFVLLGERLFLNNRKEDAIEAFEEALKIEPDLATAHNDLATIYYEKGDLKRASEHIMSAMRMAPDDEDIRYNFAQIGEVFDYKYDRSEWRS